MADLTESGLLFAPHTSAGRLPTDQGVRLFVDGLLQFGELSDEDRDAISNALQSSGRSLEDTLAEASTMLSGLSSAAGVVLAPKIRGQQPQAHRVRAAGPRAARWSSWSAPRARSRTASSTSPSACRRRPCSKPQIT